MRVLFHGVRGSAPAPGAATARYGGDTPSIEVQAAGRRLFLDAGSGLRNASAGEDRDFDIILSHYHLDHLIGLTFFAPLWQEGTRLRLWAPRLGDASPQEVLRRIYSPPFAPVPMASTPMKIEVRPYAPGDCWRLSRDVEISTSPLAHPGGCAAVRIDSSEGVVVYATDVELATAGAQEKVASFSRDADLLVIDAMSTDEEAEQRRGWGHSTWREAAMTAIAAKAGAAALFHHDPARTDDALDRLSEELNTVASQAFFSRQGLTFEIGRALTGRSHRDNHRARQGERIHGDAASPLFPGAR
jgi:phosphoribosyl 1,2-cyclic phosphodiesterase